MLEVDKTIKSRPKGQTEGCFPSLSRQAACTLRTFNLKARVLIIQILYMSDRSSILMQPSKRKQKQTARTLQKQPLRPIPLKDAYTFVVLNEIDDTLVLST